jgi:hypothetical protein
MSADAIAKKIEPYDVVGISSIFTAQTSRVIEMVKLVKAVAREKLVVVGGGNARHLSTRFFEAGADIICMSEGETSITRLAEAFRGGTDDWSTVPGIAFKRAGKVVCTPVEITTQLDNLPFPAWDLLPLERYWAIARPHGAGFDGDSTDFVHLDGSISSIQVKKWTPSIYMPKWAARTVLTITDVRVERAHDISPEDVVAEGIDPTPHRCDCEVCLRTVAFCPASGGSLILAFAELWAEINGRESWDANPLVWALTFKVDVR